LLREATPFSDENSICKVYSKSRISHCNPGGYRRGKPRSRLASRSGLFVAHEFIACQYLLALNSKMLA
jgi:hypothetical protein